MIINDPYTFKNLLKKKYAMHNNEICIPQTRTLEVLIVLKSFQYKPHWWLYMSKQ